MHQYSYNIRQRVGRKAILSLFLTAISRTRAKTRQEFEAICFSHIYNQSQTTSLDIKIKWSKVLSDINQCRFPEIDEAMLICFWGSGPSASE